MNNLELFNHTRTKAISLRALANLTRYLDTKHDTDIHAAFTDWLKRKEITWASSSPNTYSIAKVVNLGYVINAIKKLPYKYKLFALFTLVTGLRSEESVKAFNNHSELCHDGIMELFWYRRTKKANAVYCHPLLHNKIQFKISGYHMYDHINKKSVGLELRYLRKVNFTMVATKLDPLLAEFMQGRRGNVSQRHYFLPMMSDHRKKWIRVWRNVIQTVKI